LKEKLDEAGIVNIITVLAPSKEPEVVEKIKEEFPTPSKVEPIIESVDSIEDIADVLKKIEE